MVYKQQTLFFMFPGAWNLRWGWQHGWILVRVLFHVAPCLIVSSRFVLTGWEHREGKKLSFEDTNPIHGEGLIPMISPNPCYLQSPTSYYHQKQGFQRMNLKGTQHLMHNRCGRLSQIKEAGEGHSGSVCKGPNMHLTYIEKQRSSVWPKRGAL